MSQKDASVQGSDSREEDAPRYYVGIGASAGGLEPLQQFFEAISEDTGAAFIVVQHLSPDFKSMMEDLLARHTSMRVVRVSDGLECRPNTVYLIPPRKNMVIRGQTLRLLDQDLSAGHPPNYPIDRFFESLASDCLDRAIAIVLSGTGSDGSRGIRSVDENGGITLVQDPGSSQFDGMPRMAIATNSVHVVGTPEHLARTVDSTVRNFTGPRSSEHLLGSNSPHEVLARVAEILRDSQGLDFSHYRPNTVARRIARRITLTHHADVEAYLETLADSEAEQGALRNDILIGVTCFRRDRLAWESLMRLVADQVLPQKEDGDTLRIWVTACSSGQEVYTFGILLCEEIQKLGRDIQLKIFATDIDHNSLERAALGVYSDDIAAELGSDLVNRYFLRTSEGLRVAPKIREMVIFAEHNLTRDAPFTNIDIVSCRNVLIYMEPPLQHRVLASLHYALRVGGVLFLGAAESLGELEKEFDSIDRRWRVFRKRRDVMLRFEAAMGQGSFLRPITGKATTRSGLTQLSLSGDPLLREATRTLLQRRGALCLVVDAAARTVHVLGETRQFMRVPEGDLSPEVTRMLPRELSVPLGAAMHRAKKSSEEVRYSGIRFTDSAGEPSSADMTVTFQPPNTNRDEYFLILLEPNTAAQAVPASEELEADIDHLTVQRLGDLEQELQFTRENLQAAVEELQTTNEEQQATNEELLASNEELQSTNEELQSVNEELHTVNSEHQEKILELTELNQDLDNLLESTIQATIMLDKDLRIRKITPGATAIVNVTQADVGRPLEHFSTALREVELMDDCRQVNETGERVERFVESGDGIWFLMRTQPYRVGGNDFGGVILTFLDVSGQVLAQHELSVQEQRLKLMERLGTDGMWDLDVATGRMFLSPVLLSRLGYDDEVAEKATLDEWRSLLIEADQPRLDAALASHYEMRGHFSVVLRFKQRRGAPTPMLVRGEAVRDRLGKALRMVGTHTDVTELEKIRETLTMHESRAKLMSTVTGAGSWSWDLRDDRIDLSRQVHELLGVSPRDFDFRFKSILDRAHPEDRDMLEQGIQRALEGRKPLDCEYRTKAGDHWKPVRMAGSSIRDVQGEPIWLAGLYTEGTS